MLICTTNSSVSLVQWHATITGIKFFLIFFSAAHNRFCPDEELEMQHITLIKSYEREDVERLATGTIRIALTAAPCDFWSTRPRIGFS